MVGYKRWGFILFLSTLSNAGGSGNRQVGAQS